MALPVSGFRGFAFVRGGMIAAAPRPAMASWHLRVSKAPSAVTVAISCFGGVWSSSWGTIGAPPTSLVVNSAARISRDVSSIAMWILRQTLRLVPPCLRAFHFPSPSTLMPVLSTSRCNGPSEPRQGMLTFSVRRAYAAAPRPRSHLTPAARQRAEVRDRPVRADQPQQALDEPARLSMRHPEQHFHRRAGLDGGVAVIGRAATLAGRCALPTHAGIDLDRERATALQRFVIRGPVSGLVGGGRGTLHAFELTHRIYNMNPPRDLCSRALARAFPAR